MPAAGELPFLGVPVAEDGILMDLFFFRVNPHPMNFRAAIISSLHPRYVRDIGGMSEGNTIECSCVARKQQLSRFRISNLSQNIVEYMLHIET